MISNIIAFDKYTYLWLVKFQHQKGVIKFFRITSFSGDGYFYPVMALSILFLDQAEGLPIFLSVLIAFFIEIPLFITLKKLFKRDRPFEQLSCAYKLVQPNDKFSLPSGHSAAAFLIATLLAFYYPIVTPVVFTWASLVGLSRVMLGVHYPSDILSGALLGSACSMTAILTLTYL